MMVSFYRKFFCANRSGKAQAQIIGLGFPIMNLLDYKIASN